MSFFSKLFGGGSHAAPQGRRLSHPRDIRAGDIIKFRHLDIPDASGKEFEVAIVNTYIYGELCYPELVLKDREGNLLYMMTEEEDGEEYIAISKKIAKVELNEVLPPETIDAITNKGSGTRVSIAGKPEGFDDWLVEHYREVDDNVKGAFVKGDARYLTDEELMRQERFISYLLEDKEGEYALELEIYSSGETELCATVYLDISDIDEMWPSEQGNVA